MSRAMLVLTLLTAVACTDGGDGGSSSSSSSGSSGASSGGHSASLAGMTGGGLCSACYSSQDCLSGGVCIPEAANARTGYCTAPCGVDNACPTGTTCLTFSGTTATGCYPTGSCTAFSVPSSSGGPVPCGNDTWDNFAKGFFRTNCNTCHQHKAEFTSPEIVTEKRGRIRSYINTDHMPRDHTLSASDKSRILNWLDCGMP